MFYTLKKPNLESIDPKIRREILFSDFANEVNNPKYLYWDEAQYKPRPIGYTTYSPETYWFLVKSLRKSQSSRTLIKDEKDQYFSWVNLERFQKLVHEFDLYLGGNLFFEQPFDTKFQHQLITRGIIEEAIASSQLEGAHTTRQAAKKLLEEGRKPRNESEHMILNNYQAMQSLQEKYKDKELTLELLFEWHSMMVKNTDIPLNKIGVFRENKDEVLVRDNEKIYHIPPSKKFVEEEITRLIQFANDRLDGELREKFIHPIVKAIMLHFWIGYLHPFYDGNGRVARLLFYWYVLKNNYWMFSYLPLSSAIKRSPSQYGMAYVYTEQDDNDLTYFVDFNIRKIKQAQSEVEEYIKNKEKENEVFSRFFEEKYTLNDRQLRILQYLSKTPDEYTTVVIHERMGKISKATAINDLKDLVKKNLLIKKRKGRNIRYYLSDKARENFIKE